MKVEECILHRMTRAAAAMSRLWSLRLAEIGCTVPQGIVLCFLLERDAVTPKDLAERSGLDGPTMTGILDRLGDAGSVRRERREDDRRSLRVFLTDAGRERAGMVMSFMEEANRAVMKSMSVDEKAVIDRFLRDMQSLV